MATNGHPMRLRCRPHLVDEALSRLPHTARSRNFAGIVRRRDTNCHRSQVALSCAHGVPSHSPDSSSLSLRLMLCQAQTDNAAAFEALVDYLAPQLQRYRRWVSNPDDYADLRQELLLALWLALRDHPPRGMRSLCRDGGDLHDL